MHRRVVAAALLFAGTLISIDGCRNKGNGTADAAGSTASILADSDARSSSTASAPPVPPPPDAACAVAFGGWEGGPSPGDDLSALTPPLRVPAGAAMTISVRKTGHQVRIKGPAALRACTREEPEVILLATGEANVESAAPLQPGAELFLATPAFVAVFGRATLRLAAGLASSTWDVEEGEVTITNLDLPKVVNGKDRGSLKRYEEGGVLVTRCTVQAASASAAERLLLGLQSDAGAIPASSIGILTAQQIKHTRQRVLDCAFAQAHALACDLLQAESDAAAPGCSVGGLAKVREHIARAVASAPIPPGSPHPHAPP